MFLGKCFNFLITTSVRLVVMINVSARSALLSIVQPRSREKETIAKGALYTRQKKTLETKNIQQ